jgi:hypothetical protein
MNFPNPLDIAGGGVGSLLSAAWLRDHWMRRVTFFVGGWIFSLGAEPEVAPHIHIPPGFLLAFMLGMGSMSFFAKVLETWQKFNLGALARDIVRKYTGLPAVPATGPVPLDTKLSKD